MLLCFRLMMYGICLILNCFAFSGKLIHANILVHVLATDNGIEKDIDQADERNGVGDEVARIVGDKVLHEGQNTTTNNHHHKDTRGSGRVFSEAFVGQIEDARPHNRGAQAAKNQQRRCYGHRNKLERRTSEHGHGHRCALA